MIHTLADEFTAEIAELCATPVTNGQWKQFLDAAVPRHDASGHRLAGRALTMADRKRDGLERLYRRDIRFAPWVGTAHGVIQAVSTYEHHDTIVRGVGRAERNMLKTVTGEFGTLDRNSWDQLAMVLASS